MKQKFCIGESFPLPPRSTWKFEPSPVRIAHDGKPARLTFGESYPLRSAEPKRAAPAARDTRTVFVFSHRKHPFALDSATTLKPGMNFGVPLALVERLALRKIPHVKNSYALD